MKAFGTAALAAVWLLSSGAAQAETQLGRVLFLINDAPTEVTTFASDTQSIGFAVEIVHPDLKDKIAFQWIATNTTGAPPNSVIYNDVKSPIEGSNAVSTTATKPTRGWPSGNYEIKVSLNGKPAGATRFTIK